MTSHSSVFLLAAAKEQPLIDLDGTVFIQFGIFLCLMLVLRSLVFQPYLRVLAERKRRTGGARDEAEALLKQATAKVTAYESSIQAAKVAALEDRAKVRAAGAQEARSLVDAARAETHKSTEEARAKIKQQGELARKDLPKRAADLAREVAEKVLARP